MKKVISIAVWLLAVAIYRRDDGMCKVGLKCNGQKCEWENLAADHIIPWSKGGKTIVSNGQVACIPCNWVKNDSVSGAVAGA